MIIIKFIGGLGNQMFQYAFYKYLKENFVDVKADITDFFGYKLHNGYVIEKIFNVKVDKANFDEILKVRDENKKDIYSKFKRLFFGIKKSHIQEKNFRFCFLKRKRNLYLDGYWGSEKYFIDIKDIIHRDFKIRNIPNKQNKLIIKKILNTDSISIHIRRGDFVNYENLNKPHGACSISYYQRAIEELVKKIASPHFFIFSDDMEWVYDNLKLSYLTTYVTNNKGDNDFEDLRLMSLCKHNIIANSTFSWWGAWLNTNPKKIVITPKIWFEDPIENSKINFEELYPKEWIKI